MSIVWRVISGLAGLVYLRWMITVAGSWMGAWPQQEPSQGTIFAMALAASALAARYAFDPPP